MSAITFDDIETFLNQSGMSWDDLAEAVGLKLNKNQLKFQGVTKKVNAAVSPFISEYQLREFPPLAEIDQSKNAQSETLVLKGLSAVADDTLTSHVECLCAAGLFLVPIPPIDDKPTKAPIATGWNKLRSATNQNGYSNIADDFTDCQGFNFGLYHGASNTLALDLDDVELATKVFEDTTDFHLLDWLEDDLRVEIKSPKANRGKLLFKVPAGFAGSLKQLKKPKKDKPKEYDVIFELRCSNCQDVIIGQHPEGGNYQLIGNPAAIPEAPPVLLDMLLHWEAWKPCLDSALGIVEPPRVAAPMKLKGEHLPGFINPITKFNEIYTPEDILIRNGYRAVGKDRFIRPGSSSNAPGVVILRNCKDGKPRAFSFGGDDLNDGYGHDAIDVYRLLECGGKW